MPSRCVKSASGSSCTANSGHADSSPSISNGHIGPAPFQRSQDQLARNPKRYPGSVPRSGSKPHSFTDQRQKYLLGNVLRHRGRPAHVQGESVDGGLPPPIQGDECLLVATAHQHQQFVVRLQARRHWFYS